MQEHIKPLDDLITNEFNHRSRTERFRNKARRFRNNYFIRNIKNTLRTFEINIAPLASVIIMQGSQIPDSKIINEIKYSKKKESDVLRKEKIITINEKLDAQTKKAIDNARQPGTSTWISAIPLEQYGFSLNKAEFRDVIPFR